MKGEDTTVREEVRDIETGWIPWVLAAAYFPIYIVLDFVVGDVIAARVGLPQSVAVGLVSLTISAVVVLLFVLVNVGKALRGPRHSMGAAPSPVRRGASRVLSLPARGVRTVVTALGAAVLAVFVAARNGVAMLLTGAWSVVATIGSIVFRVLSLLLRPVVLLVALGSRPVVAVASFVGDLGSGGSDATDGELEAPADRPELDDGSDTVSPLRRTDDTDDGGDDPDGGTDGIVDDGAADGSDAAGRGAGGEAGDEPTVDGDDEAGDGDDRPVDAADLDPDADAVTDVRAAGAADEQVVIGDPSGVSRANGGQTPTPDRADEPVAVDERAGEWEDAGERAVEDPDDDEWPEDWISASDV